MRSGPGLDGVCAGKLTEDEVRYGGPGCPCSGRSGYNNGASSTNYRRLRVVLGCLVCSVTV